MINWKTKYLKMKLKYIKNKFVNKGGTFTFENTFENMPNMTPQQTAMLSLALQSQNTSNPSVNPFNLVQQVYNKGELYLKIDKYIKIIEKINEIPDHVVNPEKEIINKQIDELINLYHETPDNVENPDIEIIKQKLDEIIFKENNFSEILEVLLKIFKESGDGLNSNESYLDNFIISKLETLANKMYNWFENNAYALLSESIKQHIIHYPNDKQLFAPPRRAWWAFSTLLDDEYLLIKDIAISKFNQFLIENKDNEVSEIIKENYDNETEIIQELSNRPLRNFNIFY